MKLIISTDGRATPKYIGGPQETIEVPTVTIELTLRQAIDLVDALQALIEDERRAEADA